MSGKIIFALCFAMTCSQLNAQTNVWRPSPGHVQIPIWPGKIPDAQTQPLTGPEYVTNVPTGHGTTWVCECNVSQPTMTVYSPKGTNTGVAMIVFPGGGYVSLAMELEGAEVCDWLTSQGITGVLLKYRVPVKRAGPYGESPLALEDAQRTLSLVRFHAAEWHIDPHKIGVIGFSAGGHMVTATSTHFNQRSYPAMDAADKESCRPDFAVALYPGHMWNEDNGFVLNPNVPVTRDTPPTFIVQAENDPVDSVNNSLVYYMALKQAKVPVEMHLYAEGGHAFGLRRTKYPITEWPGLMEKWLGTIGMRTQSTGNDLNGVGNHAIRPSSISDSDSAAVDPELQRLSAAFDAAMTQTDMNLASEKIAEFWDAKLVSLEARIERKLDASERKEFSRSKARWRSYRTKEVDFQAGFSAGGSIQPMVVNVTYSELTEHRVSELESLWVSRLALLEDVQSTGIFVEWSCHAKIEPR